MKKIILTLLMLIVSTIQYAQTANDFGYTSHPDTTGIGQLVGTPIGTFQVSELGSSTYQVTIESPKGVNGMMPGIGLTYNSLSGNGVAGMGTNLSGISIITRGKLDLFHDGESQGIKHDGFDAFYLDGKRLCFISGTKGQEGARYTVEGLPLDTVIYHQNSSSIWFELKSHDGKIVNYGETDESQLYVTENLVKRIYGWYANRIEDREGNYMTYGFLRDENHVYPQSVSYGGNTVTPESPSHVISFTYEPRTDVTSYSLSGQEITMNKRLSEISSMTNNQVFRKYLFSYNNDISSGLSVLNTLTEKNGQNESLPSISFEWEGFPTLSRTISAPPIPLATQGNGVGFNGSPSYMSADLTGDGLSDIIEIRAVSARHYFDPPTAPLQNLTYAYVYPANVDTLGVVTFSQPFICELPQIVDWKFGVTKCYGPMFFDYDGDGKNDAVYPYYNYFPDISTSSYYLHFFSGNNMKEANGGDYVIGRVRSYEPQTLTPDNPIATWADFDGDGKGEVVVMERVKTNGNYKCRFFYNNPPSYCDIHEFSLSLPSNPKYLFTSDYNGDGLPDLLAIHQSGYKIFFNQGGQLEYTLSDASSITGNNLSATEWIYTGDFNGDGLADYLLHNGETFGNVNWFVAYGKGDGTFQKNIVSLPYDVYNQATSKDDDAMQCLVADLNGDGKSDLFINKGVYSGNNFTRNASYWLKSTGNSFVTVKSSITTDVDDRLPGNYILGNYTGKGNAEIINYGNNCYNGSTYATKRMNLYAASNNSHANGKINKITDGMGNSIEITYDNLSTGNNYTESASYGSIIPQYPAPAVTLPLGIVSSVKTSNGVCGNIVKNFYYKGLMIQLTGKGLLGFTETETRNQTTGQTILRQILSRELDFSYAPLSVQEINSIGSYSATAYLDYDFYSHLGGNYFHYLKRNNTLIIDENGYRSSSATIYTYNESTCLPVGEQSNTDGIFKAASFSNYVFKGGCHLPTTIARSQRHPDDVSYYIDNTTYTYDEKGRTVIIREHDGTSLSIETQNTYDDYGNVINKKTIAAGANTIETSYEYDDTHRFVVRATSIPASSTFEYSYDTWGNLLTETEKRTQNNPLTTTYEYDGWGNQTAMVSPIGLRTQIDRGITANGFFTLQRGFSQPWVKTTYDSTGRELSTETRGALDMVISTATEYDSKGQIIRKESNTGDIQQYEEFDYDLRGRVTRHADSTGHCSTFTYEDKTVTENRDGNEYSKTYDGGGYLKESTDPVSSVSFVYNSQFKPATATTNGHSIQMGYDHLGNVISQSDPDAGNLTYTYNALGQPLTMTDARGRQTTYTYDNLNRITKDYIANCYTNYIYGGSGNSAQLISKKTTATGQVLYTRDNYGRLVKERRGVAAKLLTFNYTYDSNGNLATVQYPDSVFVDYTYDCYGNRISMSVNGQTAWTMTANSGRQEAYTLSSTALSLCYFYDNNGRMSGRENYSRIRISPYGKGTESFATVPDAISMVPLTDDDINAGPPTQKTTYYSRMTFEHDSITGNLLKRTRYNDYSTILHQPNPRPIGKRIDTFTYDDVDRLTSSQSCSFLGNNSGPSIEKNYIYENKGSFLSKSDVGDYLYSVDKPHAIIGISNADTTLLVLPSQSAIYNDAGLIQSISEGDYTMNFRYGIERERWKADLLLGDSIIRTVRYAGNYERVEEDSIIRQFYWLDNGVLYIKEQGQSGNLYYVATDHQGSIIAVYKTTGNLLNEVFRAYYDPWGKQVITKNLIGLRRGYTGHEHMPEFGLINMNARLYDPVLGRFLSPAPYVQLPDFSQSYNRYTYCLNNPLKYVDPSGEYIGIDDLILGLVGGTINVIANAVSGNIHSFGQGLSLFGVGALSALSVEYIGPFGSAALLGAGNSIINQGFISGWQNIDFKQVLFSGVVSGVTAEIGSVFSDFFSAPITQLTSKISDEIVRSAIIDGTSYMISGFTLGTSLSIIQGERIDKAFKYGLESAYIGLASGVISGTARGYAAVHQQPEYNFEIDPNQVVKEVMASSKTPLGCGTNSVYVGRDDNGIVRYVGITARNPQVRFNEHLNSGTNKADLHFITLKNTGQLSRIQARIIEQRLINLYGMHNLYNNINSIAPKYWNKYGLINK